MHKFSENLGAWRVTRRPYHSVAPQIIGATVQNIVARDLSTYYNNNRHHYHLYTGHLDYSYVPETNRVSWVYNFSACSSRHTHITYFTNKQSALLIHGPCSTLLSQCLGAFAKLWKTTICFVMSGWLSVRPYVCMYVCMSTRPPAWSSLTLSELIFMKFYYR